MGVMQRRRSVIQTKLREERRNKARRMALLYVFFCVPLVGLIIFRYVPMYGVLIAFKDYRISKGIVGSSWNNFRHFRMLFTSPFFFRVFRNTVIISLLRIVFGFPAPIILALLINEVASVAYKRIVQSITYLPHFMSWVVLAGIIMEILSPQRGVIAQVYGWFGREAPNVLLSKSLFRPLLIVTGIWKEAGWGTVVYLAAITSIDPGLYESASIDGASRFQRAVHITIPCLIPVITILFILSLGSVLNAGFDQIFNLYNPVVYQVADIFDTYVYREGLVARRYDYSAAVGLFKNVVAVALLLSANAIIKRFSEYGIW